MTAVERPQAESETSVAAVSAVTTVAAATTAFTVFCDDDDNTSNAPTLPASPDPVANLSAASPATSLATFSVFCDDSTDVEPTPAPDQPTHKKLLKPSKSRGVVDRQRPKTSKPARVPPNKAPTLGFSVFCDDDAEDHATAPTLTCRAPRQKPQRPKATKKDFSKNLDMGLKNINFDDFF